MKIKKLELIGFKSFVDRTVIQFEHEVLGIVGPNGCGKSNIVDAIRWCMGEQSAKHLRGRNSEDVIFNGSHSRGAAEFAEVTLLFQNDNPSEIPVEYMNYAEIAVTRRLFRNGNSDYLINRENVRLKDVTDLFLGTGVGTKAYSIIEQGKIGLIVSSKPEDRRLLIEEAAGITKFKARKKQAERKMELTEQNLLRVGDIVAEIERQSASLKRQAAKAERYISYREELEDLQLYEASHRYLEHTAWLKMEASEIESFSEKIERSRGELALHETRLEMSRLHLHQAEETFEKATHKHVATGNEIRDLETKMGRTNDRIHALETRNKQAESEREEAQVQKNLLMAEKKEMENELSTFEVNENTDRERVEKEEGILKECTFSFDQAKQNLSEIHREISEIQSAVASYEVKLSGVEKQIQETHFRRERVETEYQELTQAYSLSLQRKEKVDAELNSLQKDKEASADRSLALIHTCSELKRQLNQTEKELEEFRQAFHREESHLHTLIEIRTRNEGVGLGAKTLLGLGDPSVKALLGELLNTEPKYMPALAACLGSRLHDVVVSDMSSAQKLLFLLKEGDKGRAGMLVIRQEGHTDQNSLGLPSLPEEWVLLGALSYFESLIRCEDDVREIVSRLLRHSLLVESEDSALQLRARKDCAHLQLVTLSGSVYDTNGRVEGGAAEQLGSFILETSHKMSVLSEKVVVMNDALKVKVTAYENLKEQVFQQERISEQDKLIAHERELKWLGYQKDLVAITSKLAQMLSRQKTLEGELQGMHQNIVLLASEKENFTCALEMMKGKGNLIRATLHEAAELSNEKQAQVEEQRNILTDLKVTFAASRERLNASKAILLRLERNLDQLNERDQRMVQEVQTNSMHIADNYAALEEAKESLEFALDAHQSATEHLAESRSEFEKLKAALVEQEMGLRERYALVETTNEALRNHELKFKEHSMQLTHLIDGVRDKFRGLELHTVVSKYHMHPPPDIETRARIAELAELIDRMGGVNLEALREYDEAEKRHAFYTDQKADLEKALSDLRFAIEQMNNESKKLFDETFSAINQKFQQIFPKMFRGGRASLHLTSPKDLLETGVEIFAEPPGKKMSNIDLMSGGEKALTAVSLIFAIFQVKPSPFCILDEVDAPLDEANVARYNEAIREMTDNSQFILITHIKRTMQMVDILYGVTMQEAGVSRLVSVEMNLPEQPRRAKRVGAQAVA